MTCLAAFSRSTLFPARMNMCSRHAAYSRKTRIDHSANPAPPDAPAARRGQLPPITEAQKTEVRLALNTYLKRYLVA